MVAFETHNFTKTTMKQIALLLLFVIQSTIGFAQCDAPTNLSVSQNNGDITCSWDAVPNALKYRVQFKYPGYDWTYPEYEDSTTTNSLFIPGVLASVMVDWRVSTVCSTTESAYTTAPATLTVACPQPINLTATNITMTSATLNWTHAPGIDNSYQFAYLAFRVAGSNSSWIQRGSIQGGVYSLTGLQAGTTYEWCVNQICPYFYSAPAIGTFTTAAAPCGTASLWLPASLTTTSATLRWIAVPNAISYAVEYKTNSATAWITATTSGTSLPITNLTPATGYQWRVLATCPTNVGVYSGIATFTTAAVPPPPNTCATPTNVTVSNLTHNRATVSWNPVPTATSYQYWYKLATGTTWIGVTANGGTSHNKNNYAKNTTYQYRVRAFCPSGTSAYSPEGTFTTLNTGSSRLATTESPEDAANELTLYPNPTDGEFWAKIPAHLTGKSYQVLTSTGASVASGAVEGADVRVNVRAQAAGLYIMSVLTDDGQRLSRKFIKK
ncbi:MAG: T9SS C-terminal target domain-containing protein [Cytophagales bacterium]|nr:MAG: T9SS C-terminal target domain-containing protein [Cytophagales bacterium]